MKRRAVVDRVHPGKKKSELTAVFNQSVNFVEYYQYKYCHNVCSRQNPYNLTGIYLPLQCSDLWICRHQQQIRVEYHELKHSLLVAFS